MITDDDLPAIVAAYEAAGGVKAAAARAMGLPVETFKYNYAKAERLGLTGNILYGKALDGYEFTKVSTQVNAKGDAVKEWTQQKPEMQPSPALPEGHVVKGVSTLIGPDGRTMAQWVKTREGDKTPEEVTSLVLAALKDVQPAPAIAPPLPAEIVQGLQASYIITDEHIGMYSWAKQTGQNYDLDIAERALLGSSYRLMAQTPDAEQALILKLGDTFHADNPLNRTERSGNPLDVDTRYEKVLQLGVKALVRVVDMAAAKHPSVKVKIVRGNHDPNTSFALAVILKEHYRNSPHVEIDTSPAPFKAYEWGLNMIGVHHGDTVKAGDFPMSMAAIWPEMWGRTQFRYAYSGHLHRAIKGRPVIADEIGGVEWEVFQAVAARDQWNASMGFTSKRSMTSVLHHKLYGEVGRARTYITGE